MKQQTKTKRQEILSFRTDEKLRKRVDLEARRRRLTRAQFLELIVAETVLPERAQAAA